MYINETNTWHILLSPKIEANTTFPMVEFNFMAIIWGAGFAT
jgi:hypothetical protein